MIRRPLNTGVDQGLLRPGVSLIDLRHPAPVKVEAEKPPIVEEVPADEHAQPQEEDPS